MAKVPIEERSTDELEEGLAKGIFGHRNRPLVELELKRRARAEAKTSASEEKSPTSEAKPTPNYTTIATVVVAICAVVTLAISLF